MLLGNIIGALVSAVSCVAAVEQELDTAYDVGLRDTVGIWLNTVGKTATIVVVVVVVVAVVVVAIAVAQNTPWQ